jgi:hypothetical protein
MRKAVQYVDEWSGWGQVVGMESEWTVRKAVQYVEWSGVAGGRLWGWILSAQ